MRISSQMLKALWALPVCAFGLRHSQGAARGPSALCQSKHALDRLVEEDCISRRPARESKNQYVFMISDLCRGGGGAPLREGNKDMIRSCQESFDAFFDEAKYAVATLQATGAEHGITMMMHEGLENKAGALDRFASWLRNRNVTVEFVPGKINDPHMYYFMKSYLWDMDFEKVAYFDTDFVFLRNPDSIFTECRHDFCAAPAVSNTGEALLAHVMAGNPGYSEQMSQQGSRKRSPNTKNAWNAGFFVVKPDKSRGAEILKTWRECPAAENFCLNQAITSAQAVSPKYNLQHSTLEGHKIKVESLPTMAVHGKVGRMSCEAIESRFGQVHC
mmetsp:Transcript_27758/g.63094  ORF Transcript_27758/g.63094 Transcript_27758/m.63094 type:complete len:331 (-) Transcript_27758:121-1113(-)